MRQNRQNSMFSSPKMLIWNEVVLAMAAAPFAMKLNGSLSDSANAPKGTIAFDADKFRDKNYPNDDKYDTVIGLVAPADGEAWSYQYFDKGTDLQNQFQDLFHWPESGAANAVNSLAAITPPANSNLFTIQNPMQVPKDQFFILDNLTCMLKKNLANKIFGYLARCEENICI